MRLSLKTIRLAVTGLLLVVLGAGGGYWLGTHDVEVSLSSRVPVRIINTGVPTQKTVDFSLFWDVWDRLHETYVDPGSIDDEELVYGAIRGMTAAINDPYTVFLSPEDNEQAKADLNGEFEGVGIQLGYLEEQLAVMTPLEGMPAKAAGVRAKDLILRIVDEAKGIDTDTIGMTLPEAVQLIRGPKGTPVTLKLLRPGKGEFEVTIHRDTIVVPSVELTFGRFEERWVEDELGDVAWLRLYRFGDRTKEEWEQAVERITRSQGQLTGIVLDVRNNPGGYLQGAIDIASDFIPEGVVVKQEGRRETETFRVSRRARLADIPLVVLMNSGSASASEILAGALRDRLGVFLVGEKSFGKGTVQDAVDLASNAGLHVTVARWLLPDGEWIQETGLTPDVEVTLEEAEETDESEISDIVDNQLQVAIEELGKK